MLSQYFCFSTAEFRQESVCMKVCLPLIAVCQVFASAVDSRQETTVGIGIGTGKRTRGKTTQVNKYVSFEVVR